MILIGLTSVARASISNHLVIHVNEYDLLDLEFIYIFIYSTHSFSIFVHYVHWFTYIFRHLSIYSKNINLMSSNILL